MSELTKLVVNGDEVFVETQPFTVIVHQQGIRVNVPEFVEINSRNTISCMENMTQKAWEHISTGELFKTAWEHISTGELFKTLFYKVFPPEDGHIAIPVTIEELNNGDFGVIHMAGLIVQSCEAIFDGKTKIFFRNPENHLHPKAERSIVSMMKTMMDLLGGGREVQVLEKDED